jgi:hypothetical protein
MVCKFLMTEVEAARTKSGGCSCNSISNFLLKTYTCKNEKKTKTNGIGHIYLRHILVTKMQLVFVKHDNRSGESKITIQLKLFLLMVYLILNI